MLDRLWDSTDNLHKRFGTRQTAAQAAACFLEESQEFRIAMITDDGTTHEAADVLVTVIGCLMAAGVTLDDLVLGIEAVIAKNDAKTHDTHRVNSDGKIQRIGR